MKNSARFPHLMSAPILSDLPDDQRITFLDNCSVRTFDKKTTILDQGQPTNGLYLIAYGSAEVSFLSPDGNKSIIYHAGPKELLGIIEAVAQRPCAASCAAFPGTTILFCATALLYEQLKSPVFIRNFAIVSQETLTRDNTFKSVDQFYTVEQKICRYLLHLSSQNSKFTQSQSYLANAVGCSRQTVNKELGRLRDMQIIDQTRGVIGVLDHAALEQRIEDLDVSRSGARN